MINIAIFNIYTSGGGAERVSTILANEFSKEFIVHFCAFRDNGYYQLRSQIKKSIFEHKSVLKQVKQISRYLKENDIRIVIAMGYPVAIKMAIVKTFFRKKIFLISSERNDPSRNVGSGLKRFLRKWAYLKSNKIVFQTTDAKNYFSKRIRTKGTVVLNPISYDLENNKPLSLSNRPKRIIAVGRIDPQKNFTMLVDAFNIFHKSHPDYVLDIYGNGEGEERIKLLDLIRKYDLSDCLSLKGFTHNIFEEYNKSLIYVSSSNYEGISNSIIEAMCSGLACVCTDCPCGGTRSLINNGKNGLLVTVGDSIAFANALSILADDEQLMKNISKSASELKKTLNPSVICKQWAVLFDEL